MLNKFFKIFIFILLIIYISYKLNVYNSPKISIFMPIYNKGAFLMKSIGSLQRQSLKNIEIIAINDFSTDNSLNILKKITKKDSRMKIINNDKNYGLLYSRAKGILNSRGEFIMNLDPDDEIIGEDSLKYLYEIAKKKKVDVVIFSYLINKSIVKKCDIYNNILFQPKILQISFNNNKLKDNVLWNKLIKKSILIKAYTIFKGKINSVKWNYHEDNIWSILIHKYAKSMICIKNLIYNYKSFNDSLMHNRGNILELKNMIYRGEMFIKIYNKKKEKKFLREGILQLIKILKRKNFVTFINNNIDIKNKLYYFFFFTLSTKFK